MPKRFEYLSITPELRMPCYQSLNFEFHVPVYFLDMPASPFRQDFRTRSLAREKKEKKVKCVVFANRTNKLPYLCVYG